MIDASSYASGDGAADATVGLQAAIDATGPDGVLDVPRGTYQISAPLRFLPGQRVQGQGTIRRADGYAGFMVECQSVAGVSLVGLTFDGARASSPATWQSMIRLAKPVDWLIQGCQFVNAPFKNPAVELRGAVRCRIDSNSFDRVGYGVILGLDYGETDPCHDNTISGNTMTAVDLNGVFVTENIGSAPGTVKWAVQRTAIVGNAISGCTDTGIETGSGSVANTVTGNTISACTTGILIRDNRFANVTGNNVIGCMVDGIADTGMNAGSTGLIVSGNHVWSSGNRGIFLNTGTDRVVQGNVVAGSGGVGVFVSGGVRTTLSGNIVRDSKGYGIQIGTYSAGGPSQVLLTGNIVADSGVTPGADVDGIIVMGPSDSLVLSGNRCYDSRVGPARTQRYGILVLQATQATVGLDNHCLNNHGGQVVLSPNVATRGWQAVSGSKGGNAALTSLVGVLRSQGLITDATT